MIFLIMIGIHFCIKYLFGILSISIFYFFNIHYPVGHRIKYPIDKQTRILKFVIFMLFISNLNESLLHIFCFGRKISKKIIIYRCFFTYI